uniref:Uncharacterized protein AlNc14C217G9044 n=1 Tax=Albugo laibachii Nc14 TaxID=890382 RepID=F0WRP9_9STRA|nr:conserved hypothetical protein [Albugo laibachii Nc14]|eukprot:CCA24013.1 conserved hypothetical protein [Albugo laibachii Nc14]
MPKAETKLRQSPLTCSTLSLTISSSSSDSPNTLKRGGESALSTPPTNLKRKYLDRNKTVSTTKRSHCPIAPMGDVFSCATSRNKSISNTKQMTEKLPKNTAKVEIDHQEKSLNGAPQGDLYQVQVESRQTITKVCVLFANQTIRNCITIKQQENVPENLWIEEFECLNALRSVAIHNTQSLLPMLPEALKWIVYPSITNLRSVMVRNGLLCLEDIVFYLKADTIDFLGEMVPLLLARTGSEKQFIRELTARVLESIVQVCGSVYVLQLFLSTGAKEKKSPQLTSTATQYAFMCMEKISSKELVDMINERKDSVLDEMRLLLNCRAVDGKIATRKCLKILRKALGDEAFVSLVRRQLPPPAQSEMLKASETPTSKAPMRMSRQNGRLRARVVAQQQNPIVKEEEIAELNVVDTQKPPIQSECPAKVA